MALIIIGFVFMVLGILYVGLKKNRTTISDIIEVIGLFLVIAGVLCHIFLEK